MSFFECKIEWFDEEAEDNTRVWFGYVCAENYGEAAKKVYDAWSDVIISMSLYETDCEDLLDYDDCKDFYWKEK